MSKRRNYNKKEYDELQKLKHENSKLKRQVASLRKQITRIDIDRYENLKDLIYRYDNAEAEEAVQAQREKLKQKWQCFECKVGVMLIHNLFRLDGHYYYRKCNNCGHKTKAKPYTDKVQGLHKEDEQTDK